jgi:hypothetical protein
MAISTPSALSNNGSFMALIDLLVSLTKDFWPLRNKSRESVRKKSGDGVKHYLPHVLVVGTYLLLAALTISIASLGSFVVGYRFDAVDCFSPAPENPVLYLCFVTLMFASVAGLAVLSLKLATLIGSIPLLLLLVSGWLVGKRLLRARSEDTWSRDAAIAALLAYCAVFCFPTAYGRLCPGLAYAGVSRYTPYVVLGFFGLYLYALSNHARNLRVYLLLMLLVFAALSACPLNRSDAWLVGKNE